jgi:hypothetical protein
MSKQLVPMYCLLEIAAYGLESAPPRRAFGMIIRKDLRIFFGPDPTFQVELRPQTKSMLRRVYELFVPPKDSSG